MADKLQNTSQFFRCFTIPPDPLDAQIPCPGPYLFHTRKETALCGTPLQGSSIPFLKTREYQATALVRSVRHALSNVSPTAESTNGSRMHGMRLGDQH